MERVIYVPPPEVITPQKEWFHIVRETGSVSEMEAFLERHPGFDVNCTSLGNLSALYYAAKASLPMVRLLLAHPGILVNYSGMESTPLHTACSLGNNTAIIQAFLGDPRVDTCARDHNGATPLWNATRWDYVMNIEVLIASGRDIGSVEDTGGMDTGDWHPRMERFTVMQIASSHPEATALLTRFRDHPDKTRSELREKLGLPPLALETRAAGPKAADTWSWFC
jgi:hypothetical protein